MSAYVVLIKERVTDQAELDVYKQKAPLAREGHAITPLAFYGSIDSLEGTAPEGCVILSFPSMAEARGWYDSPLYQDALAHRLKGAKYQVFIVDGVPQKS